MGLRDQCTSREAVNLKQYEEGEYRCLRETLATNIRMIEIQSAIGRFQLRRMSETTELGTRNANIWNKVVNQFSFVQRLNTPDNVIHDWYKYYITIDVEQLKEGWSRDKTLQEFISQGVPCGTGICSEIYNEEVFKSHEFTPRVEMTQCKKLTDSEIMLLVHPTLTQSEMSQMASHLQDVLEKAAK